MGIFFIEKFDGKKLMDSNLYLQKFIIKDEHLVLAILLENIEREILTDR